MNIIASLFNFAEASGWHPIIPAAIVAFPIALVFAIFLIWLAQKDKKKFLAHMEFSPYSLGEGHELYRSKN
jgi:cell division protein FtsW (lipid II flippase)